MSCVILVFQAAFGGKGRLKRAGWLLQMILLVKSGLDVPVPISLSDKAIDIG